MRALAYFAVITAVILSILPVGAAEDSPAPGISIAAKVYAIDGVAPERISAILSDAGDNWPELAAAIKTRVIGDDLMAYHNLLWQLEVASHLDRLELSTAVLLTNQDLAIAAAAEHGYDRGSEFYRRYVLSYRLDYEPVTNWRSQLKARYAGIAAGAADPLAELSTAAAEGFRIHPRGYYGNIAAPLAIDNSRAGSERELSILTAAVLRAQGYGTRFVREEGSGTSWVEAYTGDPTAYDAQAWQPVYPTAPEHSGDSTYARELCGGHICVVTAGDPLGNEQVTLRYTPVCAVNPSFTRAGEPQDSFEHYGLTWWDGGTYVPLDSLSALLSPIGYPDAANGAYFLGAPGKYLLQCGVRYPGGVVHVQTAEVVAVPDGSVALTLALDPPADLPREALAERSITLTPGPWVTADAEYQLYAVVLPEDEPSVRALELLAEYEADPRVEYRVLDSTTEDAALQEFIRDVLKVAEKDALPVVILQHGLEVTLIYRRGYDLSIRDWIERGLAGEFG